MKNVPVTNGKTSTVTFLLPTDAAAADVTPTGQSSSSRAISSTSSSSQSVTSNSHALTSSSSQSVTSRSHISTTSATPSQSLSPQTASSPNHSWIAGAVIGPLAIVAIIVLSFFLWKRHKRTKKQTDYDHGSAYGKAQLESDTNVFHELDSVPIRGEMPADEAPAKEVPENEVPAVELQARHEA